MDAIVNWIVNNPITFFVGVIIVIAVAILIWKSKRGLLYKAALYAVSKAEEAWGSDTGKIKFAEVYTYIKKEYPIVTFFFTEKQLTDIIETALEEMKRILAAKQAKLESEEKKAESIEAKQE